MGAAYERAAECRDRLHRAQHSVLDGEHVRLCPSIRRSNETRLGEAWRFQPCARVSEPQWCTRAAMAGARYSRLSARGEPAQSRECGGAGSHQLSLRSHGSLVRPRHRSAPTLRLAAIANGSRQDGGCASQVHCNDSRIDSRTNNSGCGKARAGSPRAKTRYLRGELLPRTTAPSSAVNRPIKSQERCLTQFVVRGLRGRRRHVRMLVVRGFRSTLNKMHCVQNRLHYSFVPYRGVEHDVVERARGPVGIEIVFHVGNTLKVDRIDQARCILFAMTLCDQAADLFRTRSIEKNMERVGILPQ